MERSTVLPKLIALTTAAALVLTLAPAGLAASSVSAVSLSEAGLDDDKKKRKQRGKVVKATVVQSEAPADAEETTAAEPAQVETTASQPEAVAPATEPEPSRRERRAAKREAKAAEKAERAEREAEEASRARAATTAEAAPAEVTQSAAPATSSPRATPSAAPTTTAAAPAARVASDRPTARTSDPTFRERIQVREVLLDVLVTDKKGNVVTGLGPEDFIVEEGKDVREVTSTLFYGAPEELAASGQEGTARSDRYFIVMFHDQKQAAGFLTAAQLDAGRWTRKWIEKELLPNDQVAVVGYDVRLKIYQDFTRDRQLLSQAVEAAARGKKEPDRWTSRSAPEIDPNSPSLLLNLPTGKTLAKQTRRIQSALTVLANAAEGIIGRKNLMMFSVGFGTVDQIGVYTPDPRYYEPMRQSLNNANVAVYAIDTLGARRGIPSGRDINDALSNIANETGGHYYSTFANVATPLRQVASDNLGYYLISYESEFETGTSGYRKVDIKTRDKSLRVRARTGYRYGTPRGVPQTSSP